METGDNLKNNAAYEELQRTREAAKKNNYTPSTNPDRTTPIVDDIHDVMDDNIPPYELRVKTSGTDAKNISNNIKSGSFGIGTKPIDFNDVFRAGKNHILNPYGQSVKLSESHEMLNSGVWKSKYPVYQPGIDNEDYYARMQTGWDKFVNGMGKLASKALVYGLHGTVSIEDKIINNALDAKRSFTDSTDLDKFVDDLNKSIDFLLPHYYKAETKNYGFWDSLTKDTGNFIWNDVVGEGLSFTAGAMVSAYLTGGLGGINALGNLGARTFMRAATTKAGLGIAKRFGINSALAGPKGMFNSYIRGAARAGAGIGNAVKIGTLFTKSAAFEAAFETHSFRKESIADFKNYYNEVYGRDPNKTEMESFMKDVNEASSYVYGANLFIVGSSNMFMFGKAIKNTFRPSKFLSTGKTSWLDRNVFGLKAVKDKATKGLRLNNQNKIQKVGATIFNVSKRPFSEGFYEEGLQGVASTSAKEYVESQYNRAKTKNAISIGKALSYGFEKQYTTKEGLKEVGIGAIIGGLFGARQGFGFAENSQKRKALSADISEYNRARSGLNTASVNLIKQMSNIHKIIGIDDNAAGIDFEDAVYAQMSAANNLGMLNDSFENFIQSVDEIPVKDIIDEYDVKEEDVSKFKRQIIADYKSRMDDFKASVEFANNIVGEDKKDLYKDYVARTMFMGLRAERSLSDLANRITRLDGGSDDLGGALQIMRDQDAEVRKLSGEAVKLEKKVNDLQRELEDLSTIPDINVTVTDSEGNVKDSTEKKVRAEKIKQKTKEIEDARKKYKEAVERLSGMISQPFDINDFSNSNFGSNSRVGLVGKGLGLTAEDVMEAYKQLRAADNLLSVKDRSPKQEMMLDAVNEYRQNLAYYHRTVETLHRMRDPRFGKEEEKGLAAALSAVGAKFGVEYDRETAPVMASGVFTDKNSGKRYASDEEIDKAVEEGKISSDEAFTFKVYMHMADELRGESSSDLKEVMESVTDDEYDDAMYSHNEGYTTLPNRAANRKGRKVRGMANLVNRIATKIQNGIPLSPREEDIRSKFEKFFNKLINKETSILGRLSEIQTKAENISKLESIKTQNEAIIDLFIEENSSSESEADNLRQMVEDYKEGLRLKDEKTIDDPANIDAKTKYDDARLRFDVPFGTLSTLLDTIDQLYYIEINPAGIQFLNKPQDDEIMNVSQTGDVHFRKRFNTHGNGYVSARLKENTTMVLVAGISSMQKLADEMMDVSRGDSITYSDSDMIEMSINGVKISIGYNGNYIYIDQSDIDNINKNSNIFIRNSKGGVIVFKKNGNTLEPLKSDFTFGVSNETADNEAAAELKEGSEVSFEVELNDPLNKSLFDDYHNETDPVKKDRKKGDILRKIRVKVVDGTGRVVSLLRSPMWNVVASLRAKIGEEYINIMEANPSATGNMTFERNGSKIFKVEEFLPGIPNFKLNSNGEVVYDSIKDSEIDSIEDVGYIEFDGTNGKIYLNSKGRAVDISKSDVNTFSYTKKMMDKHPNTIIPCVVIKAKNGLKYAYPVELKKAEDSESDNIIAIIDNALANMPVTDVDTVVKINNHIMYLGLDPSRYFIPISGMQESKLKEARDAIEAKKGMPDPRSWTKKGAKKKDILKNDVLVNIELSDPFQFPMVKIDLSEFKSTNNQQQNQQQQNQQQQQNNNQQNNNQQQQNQQQQNQQQQNQQQQQQNNNQQQNQQQQQNNNQQQNQQSNQQQNNNQQQQKKKSSSGLSRSEIELAERAFEGLPYKNIFDFIARQLITEKIKFYRKRHLSNGEHAKNGSINWLFERLFTGLESGNKNNIMHNSKATNLFTVEKRSTWEDGGAKSDIVENGKIIVLDENEKSKEEGFAYYVDYLRSIDDPVVKEYVNSGRTDEQMIDDLHDFLSKMKFGPSRSENDVNEVLERMNSKDKNETHAAHLYLYNYSRRLHGMDLNFGFVSEELKNKLMSELENEINETINTLADGFGTEVEGEDDGSESTYDYYVSEIERLLSNISDSSELDNAIKAYRLTIENDSNLTDEDKEELFKIIDKYESKRSEKEGSEADGSTEDATEVQGKQGSGTVPVGSTNQGEPGGSRGTEAPVEYTEGDAIEFLFVRYFFAGGGNGSFVNAETIMSEFKTRYGFSDKEASDKMKELTTQRREDGGGQRGLINNKYKIEYKNDGSLRVTTKDELEFNELKDKDERASKIFSDKKKNKGIKEESGETVNELKVSVFNMIQDKVYNTELGTFSELSNNKIETRKNVYAKVGDSVSSILSEVKSKLSNKYSRIPGTNWIYREKKTKLSKSYNLYNIETGEGFNLKLKDENRSIDSIAGYLFQSTRFSGRTKVNPSGYNDNHIARGSDLSDARREEDASCKPPF